MKLEDLMMMNYLYQSKIISKKRKKKIELNGDVAQNDAQEDQ